MSRFWPKTLAGQLVALLLLALLGSQVIAFAVFDTERRSAIGVMGREVAMERVASVVQLLADSPAESQARVINAVSNNRVRYWLDDAPAVAQTSANATRLAAALQARLGETAQDVRAERDERAPRDRRKYRDRDDDDKHKKHHHGPGRRWLTVSVQLQGGEWLNMTTRRPPDRPAWTWPSILSMVLMALATVGIVVLVIRRLTRPLNRLAQAADRFGGDEGFAPVPIEGPPEVRQTTEAFNRMGARLTRYMQDRTRMLGAISHDLRTPITTLRLRAELLDDAETRDKMLETLAEMQEMTEATLAFAREDAQQGDTTTVDLAALVEVLCEDQRDLGHDVQFSGPDRLLCTCRSVAIKRAVRNLIENACAYGARADVSLKLAEGRAVIDVHDDGPGIPNAQLEQVFEPFQRLEESRARETGGVGLGLSIARSIARGHGGDIVLSNPANGGLLAQMWIPVDA